MAERLTPADASALALRHLADAQARVSAAILGPFERRKISEADALAARLARTPFDLGIDDSRDNVGCQRDTLRDVRRLIALRARDVAREIAALVGAEADARGAAQWIEDALIELLHDAEQECDDADERRRQPPEQVG